MRTGVVILAAACCCTVARADFSYQIRIQVIAGGSAEKSATTNLIKGNRMALVSKGHTTVIDLAAETITEIDYPKKTYSVIPFARMKKLLEDAAEGLPREAGFKVSVQKPSQTKVMGILTASETVLAIEGSGGEKIAVDSWIGTVPGYPQMTDFNRRLEEKMGDVYASGMALLILGAPQALREHARTTEPNSAKSPQVPDALQGLAGPARALQGFGEATKELNKTPGAPLKTTIRISGPEGSLAEATIELDNFGGGIQDVTRFDPPAGFKKVDAALP